jgi:hypothetical protein
MVSIVDYEPREVKIPFNEWSIEKIKNGHKNCTSRREAKGEPDDWFVLDGETYELTDVHARRLEWVASQLYYEEGAASPEEFIEIWNKIYGRRSKKAVYDPNKLVIVHHFKKVKRLLPECCNHDLACCDCSAFSCDFRGIDGRLPSK